MKIKKIIVALASVGLLMAGLSAVNLGSKNSIKEVKADGETNSSYSSIFNDDWNNTSFATGYNNVLICYTGTAHGLTGDAITTEDVKDKISINGTPVWGVIPWEGQTWFKIVYSSSVSEGDILEVKGGLTIGNAVFEGFKLKLNANSKWEYYVEPVEPNSKYSSIFNDDYNNTQFAGDYNQVLIVYTGVAHGLTADAITTQDVKDKVTINGTPVWGIVPFEGQLWFKIVYPNTVNEGDILEVQDGLIVGNAVLEGFKLELNASSKWELYKTDIGTIVFSSANNDSTVTGMYGVNETTNDLPGGWNTEAFHPVDENSGVFINNTRVGTEIKKTNATTYYIAVSGATVGSIATVKGSWANSSAKFVVQEFTRQWNGTKWELPLCDYDIVSFEDANLPDFPKGNINTEDTAGYGYSADAADLAKQRGIFGLTNDTESYAFEFNFETTDTMSNWVEIRIGASGGWGHGHVIKYQFTNQWNDGVLIVSERLDDVVYNGHTKEVRTNIEGGSHLLECGAVKVLGEENLYFVYFKNNGVYALSEYWELDATPRSTKVGIYAPDTCISLTNSRTPAQSQISLDANNSTSSALYLNTEAGTLASVHNWDDYFIPVGDGITLNFNSITKDKWNYFKKPYENQLYLDLGELGVSPSQGDILYIGGMFKMAHSNTGILTAYKLNVADFYLEYDGNAWGEVSAERYAEILAYTKEQTKAELEAYVDSSVYDETNLAIVEGIVNTAKADIDAATLIEQVIAIAQNAKEQISSQAKSKQAIIEEAIMGSDALIDEYLEKYDVVTTTDFSAVGDFVFKNKESGTYSSGAYDDTTTRFITAPENLDGNLIFQFNYSSDDPSASEYGSQIYIRMRGNDSDCYRFEIATDVGNGDVGVGLAVLAHDAATQRKTYNAHFAANTQYKIECGSIDLAGYARTLLFIRINDELVLKEIVDSVSGQQAAIRIMDSFTTGDVTARMSAIEEGTTKSKNNPSLLGRLILDESSNKTNLYATLKANALPEDAVLFPMQVGAFTINGAEVNSWRSVTNIRKVGEQKYRVDFDSSELADGTVVHIGGYYSYLDSEQVKSGYRFFDAEFVYHASTDSWTQSVPTDRETLIYEAKETLSNYANLSEYSSANQDAINAIVNEYLGKIEQAETDQINAVLAEALAKIDAIPTLLDEAKAAAKSELAAYRSADLYRDEEKAELAEILQEAYADIDAAANQSEIDAIVAAAKQAIDELKTAAERDAEDLVAKKKTAKAEINALAGKLEMDRYSDANQAVLSNLTYKAIEDIDAATTETAVDQIVTEYRASIIAVETKDGSKFDGEKYSGGSQSEDKPDEKQSEDASQSTSLWQRIKNFGKKIIRVLKKIIKKILGLL